MLSRFRGVGYFFSPPSLCAKNLTLAVCIRTAQPPNTTDKPTFNDRDEGSWDGSRPVPTRGMFGSRFDPICDRTSPFSLNLSFGPSSPKAPFYSRRQGQEVQCKTKGNADELGCCGNTIIPAVIRYSPVETELTVCVSGRSVGSR